MHLSIGQKIFGIAVLVLSFMVAVSIYSTKQAASISAELNFVAKGHLPASNTVTNINILTLEQRILLERLFDLDVKKDTAARRVEELDDKIRTEFAVAKKALFAVGGHIHKKYPELLEVLTEIEENYVNAFFHAKRIIAHHTNANVDEFIIELKELNTALDVLDRSLIAFEERLVTQTNQGVFRANKEEKELLQVTSILTISAVILALLLATIVTRALVRNVKNLVHGVENVMDGDLDTKVPVITKDEVGKLAGFFNTMVDDLKMKERIKNTFGKYMDPRIVGTLLEKPEFTEIGGERREITVFFVDLKGFTTIAEKLSPNDLMKAINCFFSHMSQVISDHDGVVDKYMGDAVMAYWGEPFNSSEEHAELACQAALQAIERFEIFKSEVAGLIGTDHVADIDLDLRIGISTGFAVMGTIGSEKQRSYTVMGDPVNLGARLEGANKEYGTRIIISERTHELGNVEDTSRELDIIRVKGKEKPTRIFELHPNLTKPYKQEFREALSEYRNQQWDTAELAFRKCSASNLSDLVPATYLTRIAKLKTLELPEDWDGISNFESK